jgi:hypothetical protein
MWVRFGFYPAVIVASRLLGVVGGCFLFCTRDVFESVGGFCERYYAAEEAAFVRSLKQIGRFAVPEPVVITSGRKLRAHSAWRILRVVSRWVICGPESFARREGLEIWYGERESDGDRAVKRGDSAGPPESEPPTLVVDEAIGPIGSPGQP